MGSSGLVVWVCLPLATSRWWHGGSSYNAWRSTPTAARPTRRVFPYRFHLWYQRGGSLCPHLHRDWEFRLCSECCSSPPGISRLRFGHQSIGRCYLGFWGQHSWISLWGNPPTLIDPRHQVHLLHSPTWMQPIEIRSYTLCRLIPPIKHCQKVDWLFGWLCTGIGWHLQRGRDP